MSAGVSKIVAALFAKGFLRASLLFAGLVLLSACSSSLLGGGGLTIIQDETGEPLVQAVPEGTDPDDAVIGRREHPRIVANYGGIYSHRRSELMLARIVSRLLSAANQPSENYTITILDTPQVNAFALPGGYIYVTRGILALANDESELAAVLAHEIAHVTLRHARARSNRVRTSELVDKVITGVFGGDLETDQTAARSRVSLAAFSQSQELQADIEGVLVAGRAGYDPHAAARFLSAMSLFADYVEEEEQGDGDFLSSHPSTPDRIQKVIAAARGFGAPGLGETNRAGYLASIDGLSFGTSPKQGVIVGQMFIHPELKFMFTVPQAYTLQNGDGAVVGVANDGEAMRFDSAEVPRSMDLGEYLKSGWIAGLDEESIVIARQNGLETATARAQTDQWTFHVTAIRFDGEVYRFIFASRQDSSSFAQAAQLTAQSFRATRQSDLNQVRAVEIDIVSARAGESAVSLAQRMSGIAEPLKMFNLLNNRFEDDPIVAGESYKIVVIR